ncbi:MAG: hypothetical protein EBU82_10895 [Flavobacteriia bacterium]|nr:hypothetical protein [Flavobacteriia bacterium]
MAVSQEEIERGARLIYTCLESALAEKKGCFIGRNGTIESMVLGEDGFSKELARTLELHAGVFPSTEESVVQWKKEYQIALASLQTEPIVAGWYKPTKAIEQQFLQKYAPHCPHIPLRSLEPYYVAPELRWTNLLRGKKVAIVSSFANTCVKQVPNAQEIWGNQADSLLPPATYIPIPTGYSPVLAQGRAGWPVYCNTWQKAIGCVIDKVNAEKPDIVLIGCGGLGMVLAGILKGNGFPCVVLGGAIQVLFGIKGGRWEHHSVIGAFWNDAWVWPSDEETPRSSWKIEGGCYWNPHQ